MLAIIINNTITKIKKRFLIVLVTRLYNHSFYQNYNMKYHLRPYLSTFSSYFYSCLRLQALFY